MSGPWNYSNAFTFFDLKFKPHKTSTQKVTERGMLDFHRDLGKKYPVACLSYMPHINSLSAKFSHQTENLNDKHFWYSKHRIQPSHGM